MIVTSEYIHKNPELNEINDIIHETRVEHDRKKGSNLAEEVEIKLNVTFLEKIKNKTKNVAT